MDKNQLIGLVNQWFTDNHYNKALSTEAFNAAQEAKADLMDRIDAAFPVEPAKEA
jgi:hypothetical protein